MNTAPVDGYFRENFSLKDYTTFKQIPFSDGITWVAIENKEDIIKASNNLFSYLSKLLEGEEIQKILFTDYWINISIDFSPYK